MILNVKRIKKKKLTKILHYILPSASHSLTVIKMSIYIESQTAKNLNLKFKVCFIKSTVYLSIKGNILDIKFMHSKKST